MTPLTHHLLTLNPSAFQHATQNKFLQIAGNGTLPKVVLEKWLAQDRLYAQAYVRFASHLISTIPLPVHVGAEDLNERVLDLFLDALNNVWRELKFFGDVAREYGLDITAREEEEEGVKGYRRLFDETGGKSMAEALVLLWGTEKCYLEAWRYAGTFSPGSPPETDVDGGALRKEFIPNWTSNEFVQFVERIEKVLEEVWREDRGDVKGVERVWEGVLSVEREFWPLLE